jgi:hypothetical protein
MATGECPSVVVLRNVKWFMSALTSCAGYLYLCYVFEASLGGSSSLSLILASARMVFPFLDVEMIGTFWNQHVDSSRSEQLGL